jgi:hypothetical protein
MGSHHSVSIGCALGLGPPGPVALRAPVFCGGRELVRCRGLRQPATALRGRIRIWRQSSAAHRGLHAVTREHPARRGGSRHARLRRTAAVRGRCLRVLPTVGPRYIPAFRSATRAPVCCRTRSVCPMRRSSRLSRFHQEPAGARPRHHARHRCGRARSARSSRRCTRARAERNEPARSRSDHGGRQLRGQPSDTACPTMTSRAPVPPPLLATPRRAAPQALDPVLGLLTGRSSV